MPPIEDELVRLHAALNHRWLNPWWAKAEILLGLTAAACGLFAGMNLSRRSDANDSVAAWAGPVVLFVLGSYLALAGHRSHLYQSNNRLVAYLAEQVRTHARSPEARS